MPVRAAVLALVSILGCSLRLAAQEDPARVEALATLLMTEDRREFNPEVLSRGLNDPDPQVRQTAVTTVGRIGDHRGTRLIVPLLADSDQSVITATFFAMGLLRDSTAVDPIIARLHRQDSLSDDAASEAATALDRIGGATAAHFIETLISGGADLPSGRRRASLPGALQDAWKLGALMPSQALMRFANDTSVDYRSRMLYSLGRLRAPVAGRVMLSSLRDQTPMIREIAAKWLTKRFTDTSGLAPSAVINELTRALDDEQPGIRINAVGSLATFADSTTVKHITPMLSDGDPNVRVAAVTALGDVKGSAAAHALDLLMDRKDAGSWAMRRAGLAALAKADTAIFARKAAVWLASVDPRERMAAMETCGAGRPANSTPFRRGLADPDVRVEAAALDWWGRAGGDRGLAVAARTKLGVADPGLRAAAATALRSGATVADLDALMAAWRLSVADRVSESRLAVFATLHALAGRAPQVMGLLEDPARRAFFDRPEDPVLRADAARSWPEVARRWGEEVADQHRPHPRRLSDAGEDLPAGPQPARYYRGGGEGVNRDRVAGARSTAHRGQLPATGRPSLLRRQPLASRRPQLRRPGWRQDRNRQRKPRLVDPGRDQSRALWIADARHGALRPGHRRQSVVHQSDPAQPHLDGQYTIFGRVTGSYGGLARVVQGDVIRSIHR